jgi:hypothetical protein
MMREYSQLVYQLGGLGSYQEKQHPCQVFPDKDAKGAVFRSADRQYVPSSFLLGN